MKLFLLFASLATSQSLNDTERAAPAIQDEKVLMDDPEARLNQLTRFSDDLLDNWFGFLKSKNNWKGKFRQNANRMRDAYERCGHFDKSIDYSGKFAVPISKVSNGSKMVDLLNGMSAKEVVAVHLKLDGDFNSPYRLFLTPEEGSRTDGFMVQFGLKTGTKTSISACSSDTVCKELDWASHTRRRFKLRRELLIRYGDGHINIYNGRYPDDEVISFYSHAIKRTGIKHLSFNTNTQSKPFIATVENVLYDKHQQDELPIKLYTPNRYHYQTILDGLASKGVKTVKLDFASISNDAHIAIASGTDKSAPKWEIIIGAKGATQTVIKPCADCSAAARINHSKDDYRFWSSKGIYLTMEPGRISLSDFRGREIIQVADSTIRRGKMKFLKVASTTGASGIWTISEIEFLQRERRDADYYSFNETDYSYDYAYADYGLQADDSVFNVTRGIELSSDFDYENDVFAQRIDEVDPFRAVKQLTSGYSKWTSRFLSNCRGQSRNNHQVRRMELWNKKLMDHLAAKF